MNSKKSNKRKRGKAPLVDGDAESAQAVTHRTLTETRDDGSTVTQRVLISLDPPPELATTKDMPVDLTDINYEMDSLSPLPGVSPAPEDRRNSNRVRILLK